MQVLRVRVKAIVPQIAVLPPVKTMSVSFSVVVCLL